jgi:prepilin-type N-terminal cleavage/methylation domain-containing protein
MIWFADGCPRGPGVSVSRNVDSSFAIFIKSGACTSSARSQRSVASRPQLADVKTRAQARGFTLLEVLLAIAIIALIATVLIGGSARLLNDQPVSVDDVFLKAVQEARKTALKSEHDIRLKFDKEKKQFLIVDGNAASVLAPDGYTKEEAPLKTFPVFVPSGSDLTVEFLGASAKGGNVIMVGGVMIESQPIPFVTFYSDGTCTAFRLQVMRNGAAHILSIDPWTCAQVLTPSEPNAF